MYFYVFLFSMVKQSKVYHPVPFCLVLQWRNHHTYKKVIFSPMFTASCSNSVLLDHPCIWTLITKKTHKKPHLVSVVTNLGEITMPFVTSQWIDFIPTSTTLDSQKSCGVKDGFFLFLGLFPARPGTHIAVRGVTDQDEPSSLIAYGRKYGTLNNI